jgi:malonyl CoA-acyl carrier protein transacylase
MSFSAARVPVISNVNAQPYPTQNASESIKMALVNQIKSPVLWTQSIRFLLSRGVTEFKEMGPGNVLTRLVQQIRQDGSAVAS